MNITDEQFDELISQALSELPKIQVDGLKNVAIVYADEPTPKQRETLKLRCNQTLLGLFEGLPLTKRAAANSIFGGPLGAMPDKITLFKLPLINYSKDLADLKRQVKHTLWHEIAHYYGLDHDQIHKLEQS